MHQFRGLTSKLSELVGVCWVRLGLDGKPQAHKCLMWSPAYPLLLRRVTRSQATSKGRFVRKKTMLQSLFQKAKMKINSETRPKPSKLVHQSMSVLVEFWYQIWQHWALLSINSGTTPFQIQTNPKGKKYIYCLKYSRKYLWIKNCLKNGKQRAKKQWENGEWAPGKVNSLSALISPLIKSW